MINSETSGLQGYYPADVLKYCPRCSAGDFVFQGEKSFQCGACGFQLFINAAAAVVAFIEDTEGRILFTRRGRDPKKGTLDLPGGFVDLNETAEQALKREVKEELNLDMGEMHYFCSYPNTYLYGGIVYHTLDLTFRCSVIDLGPIRAGDDVGGYVFLSPGEIRIDDLGLDSIREIVRRYLAERS